ncbi:MAG: bifunctional glutamate N-acetyltransferase/amino-acid acetyltransferase ArgJ [Spirochaetales bacterium]|nr:bifunctional glutamate N-acetyltransferase/amino-acid acetyltransferase ArgJ [Spirochaetales bacterium]
METYRNETDYLNALGKRALLPAGFKASSLSFSFFPEEVSREARMNLNLILLDQPTDSFAGVFTRNAFPGAPVIIGKKRLEGLKTRGVIINNKIANVLAPDGLETAERILDTLAAHTGGSAAEYFSSSTGVIGWKLPGPQIKSQIPGLVESLQSDSILSVARGIMTTDAYPKIRSASLGDGRIVAIAKGAGMIEPNMATMLVFVLTDIDIPRKDLQQVLGRTVERTFNRISVDGDQSTSDMVLAFSSKEAGGIDVHEFEEALARVFGELAMDVVRNGEGTGHVMEVQVEGAENEGEAAAIGKAVVNSPLVKTAVFGNDPNIGRVVAAVGDFAGNAGVPVDLDALLVAVGGETVFENRRFSLDPQKENRLFAYLQDCALTPELKGYPEHDKNVVIRIIVGRGSGSATVFGSDLSYEYIRENADYRT